MSSTSDKPDFGAAASTTTIETPATKSNDPASHHVKGLKLAVLLGSLTLVTFLSFLDTSIIGTVRNTPSEMLKAIANKNRPIPYITSDFHSLPDEGWYIGAYTLGAATLQPLSGKLYTHFPTKLIFLSFLFLFEVGSLICGVAPSSTVFIVGRAIAGLGVSGIFNGALTIIAASVENSKTPTYTGLLFGVSQMGMVVGPLVGGGLTEHVTWRWCKYQVHVVLWSRYRDRNLQASISTCLQEV